jgi:hypothetical protein
VVAGDRIDRAGELLVGRVELGGVVGRLARRIDHVAADDGEVGALARGEQSRHDGHLGVSLRRCPRAAGTRSRTALRGRLSAAHRRAEDPRGRPGAPATPRGSRRLDRGTSTGCRCATAIAPRASATSWAIRSEAACRCRQCPCREWAVGDSHSPSQRRAQDAVLRRFSPNPPAWSRSSNGRSSWGRSGPDGAAEPLLADWRRAPPRPRRCTTAGSAGPRGGAPARSSLQAVCPEAACSYSSWRRSQKTCSPSSLRPIGVRSRRP